MRSTISVFLDWADELDHLAVEVASDYHDERAVKKLVELVRFKASDVKKKVAELDASMERTTAERERIKRKEIELNILENQFRKSLHQE